MEIKWGKNPEFTFIVNCSIHVISFPTSPEHSCFNYGYVAIPFALSWWRSIDADNNKNYEISFDFLCLRFSFEMWRWKK